MLARLPHILRGHYDIAILAQLAGAAAVTATAVAVAGMVAFSRRDV
jgi:hypothetical protein